MIKFYTFVCLQIYTLNSTQIYSNNFTLFYSCQFYSVALIEICSQNLQLLSAWNLPFALQTYPMLSYPILFCMFSNVHLYVLECTFVCCQQNFTVWKPSRFTLLMNQILHIWMYWKKHDGTAVMSTAKPLTQRCAKRNVPKKCKFRV